MLKHKSTLDHIQYLYNSYFQTQLLMYNKTDYRIESWDTPTPLSNCHHWCLSRNA